MQHFYGLQSLANTNISAANTSSAELCSIVTDDVSLSNELQNTISTVLVVQTSTSKTTKEFKFGSLHKKFNLFETSGVRTANLDMLLSALRTTQPTSTDSERIFSVTGNFKTKIRSRIKFRDLIALVFLKYYEQPIPTDAIFARSVVKDYLRIFSNNACRNYEHLVCASFSPNFRKFKLLLPLKGADFFLTSSLLVSLYFAHPIFIVLECKMNE
jgi:hypothetical protein